MSDLDPSPEPPKPTSGPTSGSRLWRVILGWLVGVIAGAARGAGIGAAVGAGACFLALMVYALFAATTPPDPGATPGDILGILVIAAMWFGIGALTLGGIAGAVLGTVLGAFCPVRLNRRDRGARAKETSATDLGLD